MTPIDLISLALKQAGVVGVGQTPLSEDANDAFTHLNMMLGQWNKRRWLVYHLVDVACYAAGTLYYRIGAGQQLNARGRVTGIESAYWRQNGVDYPLRVITSREEYSRITIKNFAGFPNSVWLDADYPTGNLYVWPAPTTGEIHVVVQEQLSAFPDLTTPIALPDEYRDALFHNLVVRLREAYGRPPSQVTIQLAKVALNTIRGANAQIGTLQMPANIPTRGNAYDYGGLGGAGGAIDLPLPPVIDPGTGTDPIVVNVDGGREG